MENRVKEIIKSAMQVLKSVERKTWYDQMYDCDFNNGYDGATDLKMRKFFQIIRAIADAELRQALADIWNATLSFYYSEPYLVKEETPSMSETDIVMAIIKKEGIAKSVHNFELVNTSKGRRAILTMSDGTKKIRKLELPQKAKKHLNFEACEQELCELAVLGTRDYRSALGKLLEKYAA